MKLNKKQSYFFRWANLKQLTTEVFPGVLSFLVIVVDSYLHLGKLFPPYTHLKARIEFFLLILPRHLFPFKENHFGCGGAWVDSFSVYFKVDQ